MIESSEILKMSIYSWMQRTFKEKGVHSAAGKIALGSTKGIVRNDNQDRAAIVTLAPSKLLSVPVQVAVLCDGIGGLKNGAEAATLAISSFVSQLIYISDGNIKGFLEHAANIANKEVYSCYKGGGGCTLSAASTTPSGVIDIVSYGDSRVYLFDGKALTQLSMDDTLNGQLASMDRRMVNTMPEFKHLVQFVGMEDRIETSMVKDFELGIDDKILIASDGAYEVDKGIVEKILSCSTSAEDGVKKLLLLSEWLGGKDNATAVYLPAHSCASEIPNMPSQLLEVCTWNAAFSFTFENRNAYIANESSGSQNIRNQFSKERGEKEKLKIKKISSNKQYKAKEKKPQRSNDNLSNKQPKLTIEYDKEKDK